MIGTILAVKLSASYLKSWATRLSQDKNTEVRPVRFIKPDGSVPC